jgi:hypothetical protein
LVLHSIISQKTATLTFNIMRISNIFKYAKNILVLGSVKVLMTPVTEETWHELPRFWILYSQW